MKNKILMLALTGALMSPSAFAAEDTSGMHYTSASEGFYASIRTAWTSGSTDDADGEIDGASSRFGVRGTNDLGGGLEGFYNYEAGINHTNSASSSNTRLAHVGLRGAFGELVAGTFWNNLYNFSYGATDVANKFSGYLVYSDQAPARISNALQYTTPDLNGFQGSFVVVAGSDGAIDATARERVCRATSASAAPVPMTVVDTTPDAATPTFADCASGSTVYADRDDAVAGKDDNAVDAWGLAANYGIQGFSVGGSYYVRTDELVNGTGRDDAKFWTVKLGYGQDNWYVNSWYGENNNSDSSGSNDDAEIFSIAGGVSVDRVNLYAVYETQEEGKNDTTYGTLGVQYNLGSQSRVYVEYFNQDVDSMSDEKDQVQIGLRHDF